MNKILFAGHSHLKALEKAYEKFKSFSFKADFLQCGFKEFKPNTYRKFFNKRKYLVNKNILKSIKDKNYSHIFLCIYGNSHNIIGFNNSNIPFNFIYPRKENNKISLDVCLIPFEVIRNRIINSLSNTRIFIELISKELDIPIFMLETPPVIDCNKYLSENLNNRFNIDNFNSFDCRHKIWLLSCELVREICNDNNIEYISNPSTIYDDNLKFKKSMWCQTCTHGNDIYGHDILLNLEKNYFE